MADSYDRVSDRVDERWASHRREHELEFRAVVIAATDIERRLESMNELRAQIERERRSFVSLATYDARHDALAERISRNENQLAGLAGRFSVYAAGAGLLGSVIVTVILRFMKL